MSLGTRVHTFLHRTGAVVNKSAGFLTTLFQLKSDSKIVVKNLFEMLITPPRSAGATP